MSTRYVLTDASGNILRTGYATNPAEQASGTEVVYAIASHDGAVIPDADVKITAGEFAAVGGYAGDLPTGDVSEVVE